MFANIKFDQIANGKIYAGSFALLDMHEDLPPAVAWREKAIAAHLIEKLHPAPHVTSPTANCLLRLLSGRPVNKPLTRGRGLLTGHNPKR
jgi:hypothetical protein